MSNIYANTIDARSGNTVTFPQNIKVLGTATYEDVANVDSVGIITAQSGINISGGDLTAGSQYDRLTVTPGDGIYNSNGTTVTIAGRTNDGDLAAFKVDRYGSGTTADTKVLINYAGKVGIGTDNPVGNLEIRDSKANLIVAKDGLTVKSNSDLATQYDLIQLGAGGALASYSTATATADTQLIHNAYRHSGGEWRRRYADTAMRLRMNSPGGAFIFESVATGIADEQITFSEKLRITSDGKTGIGGVSSPQNLLNVNATGSMGLYGTVTGKTGYSIKFMKKYGSGSTNDFATINGVSPYGQSRLSGFVVTYTFRSMYGFDSAGGGHGVRMLSGRVRDSGEWDFDAETNYGTGDSPRPTLQGVDNNNGTCTLQVVNPSSTHSFGEFNLVTWDCQITSPNT